VGFFILGDIIMNKGRLALRGRARTRVARKEGSGKNGETYVVQEVSNRPELESTAVVSLALHSYRVKEERQRNTGKRSSSTSGSESAGRWQVRREGELTVSASLLPLEPMSKLWLKLPVPYEM
jgi:hypothetical protein